MEYGVCKFQDTITYQYKNETVNWGLFCFEKGQKTFGSLTNVSIVTQESVDRIGKKYKLMEIGVLIIDDIPNYTGLN